MNAIERAMWIRLLDEISVAVAAILLMLLLVGCAPSVTVRAPTYDPPPLDPELLIPCFQDDPLLLPADGSFGEVYRTAVMNMQGPIANCVKRADRLQAVVRDREASREKFKKDNVTPPEKPWWQW